MRELFLKYKHFLAYVFFGVCTTSVNIAAYFVCAHWLELATAPSTVIAWFLAVLFAFLTNKSLVFGSRIWNTRLLAKELVSFYLCRLGTGVLDLTIMLVSVDLLEWNGVLMKAVSDAIAIVLNYIAGRFIVFRKGRILSDGKQ